MGAALDMKIDQPFKALPIDLAVFEGCDQGDHRTGEHQNCS
jgi:hypothetical protein